VPVPLLFGSSSSMPSAFRRARLNSRLSVLAQSFAQLVKDGKTTADSAADLLARRLGMEQGRSGRRYALELMSQYLKSASVKGIQRGSIVRTKRGNLCIVKDMDADKAKLVKVGGDEAIEDVKSLKLKSFGLTASNVWQGPDGKWYVGALYDPNSAGPYRSKEEATSIAKNKSNEWGFPTSDPTCWSNIPTKLTNWYGQLTNVLKTNAPALKDVDLTGEEQKAVEEEVEAAFMKIAKELGMKSKWLVAWPFSFFCTVCVIACLLPFQVG